MGLWVNVFHMLTAVRVDLRRLTRPPLSKRACVCAQTTKRRADLVLKKRKAHAARRGAPDNYSSFSLFSSSSFPSRLLHFPLERSPFLLSSLSLNVVTTSWDAKRSQQVTRSTLSLSLAQWRAKCTFYSEMV